MSTKTWVSLLLVIGSIVGGYIPTLFGAGIFSLWGLFGSGVGAFVGIWLGLKLGD